MQQHWSHLCSRIGDRRAGSAGDRAAAEYILERFRAAGLADVRAEAFPRVEGGGSQSRAGLGELVAGSSPYRPAFWPARPALPAARAVQGELVWVEMP